MQKIKKLIQELNQKPMNLTIVSSSLENGTLFSYLSYHDDLVYGRYFEAKTNIKKAWIVLYHGLGAHTNTPGYIEFVSWWLKAGYDVIGIDIRNQGGLTKGYPTPDSRGLYLSGLETFENYYYTAIYLDAYRLVDVAALIKPNQMIIANGGSQGGALSLFVGATHHQVDLIISDMPSNTDILTLIESSTGGFKAFHDHQISAPSWLIDEIDILGYAKYIQKPALISAGLLDTVCPIGTAIHLYEKLDGEKTFVQFDQFGHGGYDLKHFPQKLEFIKNNQKKDR